MSTENENLEYVPRNEMFYSECVDIYRRLDTEELDDLLVSAYARYNESERIILDIELVKKERNEKRD